MRRPKRVSAEGPYGKESLMTMALLENKTAPMAARTMPWWKSDQAAMVFFI